MGFFYHQEDLGFESGGSFFSLYQIAQQAKRPVYVYQLDEVVRRYRLFKEAFAGQVCICYALKANSHPALLKVLASEGAGADVVSAGEILQALRCGFSAEKIVFSGVGKEKYEIQLALEQGIKQINVESPAELRRIGAMAQDLGVQARVAFRLNPDVNPQTHPYIRTGFRENKFGMDASFMFELEEILKKYKSNLSLVGLTLHIGSQLRDLAPIEEAVRRSLPLLDSLRQTGYPLSSFDVGGGLGIDYHSDDDGPELANLTAYAQGIKELLRPYQCEIICEPGRILTARAGVLLGEVQYLKETPFKHFAILNTGMHHLMRPSLYEAYHRILPVRRNSSANISYKSYDVVGPICESADTLGRERHLPELGEGDYLAIMDVGAYGAVMASNYNSHELPLEWAYFEGQVFQ